jgi:hypothetical protein
MLLLLLACVLPLTRPWLGCRGTDPVPEYMWQSEVGWCCCCCWCCAACGFGVLLLTRGLAAEDRTLLQSN